MTAIPKLVSMDHAAPAMSRQGQPMVPLVSADLDGSSEALLSAGVVHMKPAHASRAHWHVKTDVIVLLRNSGSDGALTLFGDQLENEIWQQPNQALWIPHGIPHAAVNPSRSEEVVAFEFRSNPILGDDNHLLEVLDSIVGARCRDLQKQMAQQPFARHRDADLARWSM